MERAMNVLFVGSLGFPFGSAAVYRKLQLSLMFNELGYKVLVVNRRGSHCYEYTLRENIKVVGSYNDINYIHTSLKSYRPNHFAIRNIFKIFGYIGEFLTIAYQRIFCKCKLMVCDSTNLSDLRYYYYASRLFKMKFIYDYVEFVDSLRNRDARSVSELKLRFENNVYKYADAFIVISKYLYNFLGDLDKSVKKIIIPPTQNFKKFDIISKFKTSQKYFLYCGAISYIASIKFVINAYIKTSAIENKIKLYLVINGSKQKISELQEYVKEIGYSKHILILSQLPYDFLISYYKSSEALLLPLRNTIQDNARFPFKIVEYLASKRPIIMSNVGVVPEYFDDGKDAIIAMPEELDSFVDKINSVILSPVAADKIGSEGYKLGRSKFNNNMYNKSLLEFLNL